MKPRKITLLLSALASVGAYSASATTYTWNPNATTTGSNGSGTWDNSTAIWATGGADTTFASISDSNVSPATTNATAITNGSNTFDVASSTGLAVGQYLSLTQFPVGTYITAISGNTITLSSAATGGLAANNAVTFSIANAAVFGSGAGAAGTVTVNTAQNLGYLTINPAAGGGNYVFSGTGSIALGAGGSSANGMGTIFVNSSATLGVSVNTKGIVFGTSGQTLTFTGGGTSTFNGVATGSTGAIAASSTVAITAGTYTGNGGGNVFDIGSASTETGGFQMSGGTITTSSNFQVGQSNGGGFANLTGGTINSKGQFTIGRNSPTNIGKVVVNGGSILQTQTDTNGTQLAIGRASGNGTLDVRSGTVSVIGNGINNANGGVMVFNADGNNAAGGGTLKISGGTVTVKDLRFNGSNTNAGTASAGSSTLLMTGGSLYVGGAIANDGSGGTAGGIRNNGTGTSTYGITLSGGTVGANANWSSNLNMTLATTNGSVTFKAADASNAAFNISLSGTLSGNGGLIKTGGGMLSLTGGNTYTGDTKIMAGTLSITTGYLADGADVYLTTGSTFNLNFAGSDTIRALYIDGVAQAPGTYGFSGLQSSFFTGAGTLNVTAVPEPATWGLLGVGMSVLAIARRRRNSLS